MKPNILKAGLISIVILVVLVLGITIAIHLSESSNNQLNQQLPLSYPIKTNLVSFTVGSFTGASSNSSTSSIQTPEVLKNYKISNSDGTSITLDYPSDWEVKTLNNNHTYAFIAPDGSALGYDFAQYNGIYHCQTSQIEYISNPNQKLARYFDDKTNKGVNWYVCDYDETNNMYYIDNYDLLTIYAKNNTDLNIIDNILISLKRNRQETAVAIGRVFDFSFEYNPILGKVADETSSIQPQPGMGLNCDIEKINFSNSTINLIFNYGQPDCLPGSGASSSATMTNVNSRNNLAFKIINTPDDTGNSNYYVWTNYEYQYNPNTYGSVYSVWIDSGNNNMSKNQSYDAVNKIIRIISTLIYNPKLKTQDFDKITNV